MITNRDINQTLSNISLFQFENQFDQLLNNDYFNLNSYVVILFSASILFSIIGNSIVILVMSCGFRSARLSICKFLFNLAIFNLIMSLSYIPFTYLRLFFRIKFIAPFICPLKDFIQNFSVNGSILSLTYLSIDRFQAVAHPLKHKSKITKSKMNLNFALIWLFSSFVAFIQLFAYKCFKTIFVLESTTQLQCYCIDWNQFSKYSYRDYLMHSVWNFLQAYFVPLVIMIVMYTKITNILWLRAAKNYKNLHESANVSIRSRNAHENEKFRASKTIKILFGMIGIFGINWLPLHLFHSYTAFIYLNEDLNYTQIEETNSYKQAYYICHLLSLSCAFINPICFSFVTRSFKRDLISLLLCKRYEERELLNLAKLSIIRDTAFSHRSTFRRSDSRNITQRLSFSHYNYLRPQVPQILRAYST